MKEGLSEMTTKRPTKKKQPKRQPTGDRPRTLDDLTIKKTGGSRR